MVDPAGIHLHLSTLFGPPKEEEPREPEITGTFGSPAGVGLSRESGDPPGEEGDPRRGECATSRWRSSRGAKRTESWPLGAGRRNLPLELWMVGIGNAHDFRTLAGEIWKARWDGYTHRLTLNLPHYCQSLRLACALCSDCFLCFQLLES